MLILLVEVYDVLSANDRIPMEYHCNENVMFHKTSKGKCFDEDNKTCRDYINSIKTGTTILKIEDLMPGVDLIQVKTFLPGDMDIIGLKLKEQCSECLCIYQWKIIDWKSFFLDPWMAGPTDYQTVQLKEWPGKKGCKFSIKDNDDGSKYCEISGDVCYTHYDTDLYKVGGDNLLNLEGLNGKKIENNMIYYNKSDDSCNALTKDPCSAIYISNNKFYTYNHGWQKINCDENLIDGKAYINYFNKVQIITNHCKIKVGSKYGENKLYLYGNDNNKLIQCQDGGYCFEKDSYHGCYIIGNYSLMCYNGEVPLFFDRTTYTKYYMNDGYDKSSKPLIKCRNGRCETITVDVGYYINSITENIIYCERKNSCNELEKNTSATPLYYLNSGDDKEAKPLIKCVKSGCKTMMASYGYLLSGIENMIIYCETATNCNDDRYLKPLMKCDSKGCSNVRAKNGYYLNSANENLIYCRSSSFCSEVPVGTSSAVNFYYLNKGDDRDSNPLINCVSGKCKTVMASIGYYLYSVNMNVIYCRKLTICNEIVSNLSSDLRYYLNNGDDKKKYPLIECNGTCTIRKASPGYIADGAGSLIYCESSSSCNMINKSTQSLKYYLNRGDNFKLYPLIKCIKDSCTTIRATIGFYVNSENNGLINCSSTTICKQLESDDTSIIKYYLNNGEDNNSKPIIKCDNNVCETMEVTVGYYLEGVKNYLTNCKSTNICIRGKNTSTTLKYYLNNGVNTKYEENSKPLIRCDKNSCKTSAGTIGYYVDAEKKLIYCESTKVCHRYDKSISAFSNFFLNSSVNEDSKPLIKCNKSNCILVSASPGYYLGGENNLIYCESDSVCRVISKNESSTPVYFTNEGSDRNPKTLIKCYDNMCKSMSAIGYNLDDSNKLFYCKSMNSCDEISITTSDIPIHYLNNGDDMDSMPLIRCAEGSCETTEAMVGAYLTGTNKSVIYCESETFCYEVNNTSNINKYYLNGGNYDDSKPIIKCNKNSCTAVSGFKGYYIDGENNCLIHCENSTNCYLISKNTEKTSNYYINGGDDRDSKPLIVCNDGNCAATTVSIGYYVNSADSILIYCKSPTSCNEVDISNLYTSKYYINNGDNKESNPLILCDNNSCITTIVSVGYYLNGANNKLIYCTSAKSCSEVSENTNTTKYYINNGNDSGDEPIIICNRNGCNGTKVSAGYYINGRVSENGTNKSVISCSSKVCKEITVNTLSTKYYFNSGDDKNSNPLIKCTDSNGCITSKALVGGYVITDDTTGNNDLIYCESEKVCKLFDKNTIYTVFYLNNGDNSSVDPLIKCNREYCGTSTANVGGYIDGFDNLIYCESDTKCKIISKNTSKDPKYYVNGGNDDTDDFDPLIECYSGSCGFTTYNYSNINEYAFFLNGAGSSLIKCEGTDGCEEVNPNYSSIPLYYLCSGSTKLIKCVEGSCRIETPSHGGYLNGDSGPNNYELVIYCDKNKECKEESIYYMTKFYINNGDSNFTEKLIKCENYKCKTITVSPGDYEDDDKVRKIHCEKKNDNIVCNEV
ncbi:hypothetical protein PIROE2DRAFT_13878 [Piromyces sp. E2]|nr:hypothetical protein PIROE2DRAFT_13878 [Piromyces sp. E2]|eukprot:OUM60372.1 hypothetical protein PIROE2DRAFT_13878 [Piromyces sp. E2]